VRRWNRKLKLRIYRDLPDPAVDNSPRRIYQ
jgi:hypothetical protein